MRLNLNHLSVTTPSVIWVATTLSLIVEPFIAILICITVEVSVLNDMFGFSGFPLVFQCPVIMKQRILPAANFS
jgi:hypothetical protein